MDLLTVILEKKSNLRSFNLFLGSLGNLNKYFQYSYIIDKKKCLKKPTKLIVLTTVEVHALSICNLKGEKQ